MTLILMNREINVKYRRRTYHKLYHRRLNSIYTIPNSTRFSYLLAWVHVDFLCLQYTFGPWMSCALPSHWRHDERDGGSNHQYRVCLLNRLFMRISKETSKLHVTGLCERNSPRTDEFRTQKAGNAENVSIWLRRHITVKWLLYGMPFPH